MDWGSRVLRSTDQTTVIEDFTGVLNSSAALSFNEVGTAQVSGTTPSLTTNSGQTNTGNVTVKGKTSGSLKITTADATAQTVTLSAAAQTVGAATLSIPNLAGTNATIATTAQLPSAAQLVPTQTSHAGQFLTTDGTTSSWVANAATTAWGDITGTLSDQTDLQTALNGYLPVDGSGHMTGGLDMHDGEPIYNVGTITGDNLATVAIDVPNRQLKTVVASTEHIEVDWAGNPNASAAISFDSSNNTYFGNDIGNVGSIYGDNLTNKSIDIRSRYANFTDTNGEHVALDWGGTCCGTHGLSFDCNLNAYFACSINTDRINAISGGGICFCNQVNLNCGGVSSGSNGFQVCGGDFAVINGCVKQGTIFCGIISVGADIQACGGYSITTASGGGNIISGGCLQAACTMFANGGICTSGNNIYTDNGGCYGSIFTGCSGCIVSGGGGNICSGGCIYSNNDMYANNNVVISGIDHGNGPPATIGVSCRLYADDLTGIVYRQ